MKKWKNEKMKKLQKWKNESFLLGYFRFLLEHFRFFTRTLT